MRRQWWLMAVVLVTCFKVPSALAFHVGPTGNEELICSRPEVIFCDNFEDRAEGPHDWIRHTYKNAGWSISDESQSIVRTQHNDGIRSLQHLYSATPRGGDNGGAGFMSALWVARRTIYARWYVKFSSNFVRSPIAEKHAIVQPAGAPDGRNHPFSFSFGAVVYGREGNYPILRQNLGTPLTFGNNTWYCVEFRVTANDPGTAANGYVQGWIGGVQKLEYPNIQLTTTNNAVYNYLELSGYWNCLTGDCMAAGNSHPTMQRWIDRVVVSTARIGC